MSTEQRSLVLHYDELRDEIVFFSIAASVALPLRDGDGFALPLSGFRSLEPGEAERRIGAAVFSFFDSLAA